MFCFLKPGQAGNQMTFVLVDFHSSHYFSYHSVLGKPSLSPFILISFYFQLIQLPFLDLKCRQVSVVGYTVEKCVSVASVYSNSKNSSHFLVLSDSGLAPSIPSQWLSAFQ